MQAENSPRSSHRAEAWRYAPAVLIFGIGLVLSLMLFRFVRDGEQADAQREFERRASTMARGIERDLAYHVQFVNQFRPSGKKSNETEDQNLNQSYASVIRPIIRNSLSSAPGFEAAQFVGFVRDAQREIAEEIISYLLQQDFQISDSTPEGMVPAASRPYHIPIYSADSAVGPIDDRGLDLARDPRQLTEFTKIVESGEIAAWPASTLEVTGPELRFRIALPTYDSAMQPRTAAERRAAITGFSSFILRPDVVFGMSLLGGDREPIDLRVYDDALTGSEFSALIYTSAAPDAGPASGARVRDGLHWGTTMTLADRTWRLEFTPAAGYSVGTSWISWGALAGGVLMSALIALYVITVVRNAALNRRHEAERRAFLLETNTALEAEIAERRQVEAALRRSEGQYRAVVEQVQEVIFQSDAGGRWTFLNPAWSEITGFSIEESLGLAALEFVHGDDARAMAGQLDLLVHGAQDAFRMEVRHLTKDGGVRWLDVYACALRDDSGSLTGVSGTLADITDRKEFESRLAYQAFHDPLTELPNRGGFSERLGEAVERAEATGSAVVLMLMDLDGFKVVNDTYGHPAGDVLLVEVGRRLRACVREEDLVARLGGDEFTVVIERRSDQIDAQCIADRMIAALHPPFMWDGHDLAVGASIGIALSTRSDRPDRDELVRRADVALYEAKARGKGRACTYNVDRSIELERRSA